MASKLTEDQLDELKEAFSIFDSNNDGQISVRELGSVMRALGLNPTEAEIISFMNEIDTDRDGYLNFQEFANAMVDRLKNIDTEEDIIEAFKVFDIENKGYFEIHELRNIVQNLGEKLTEDEIKLMFQEADHDGDGVVNYEDFVKIMTRKTK